MSDYKVRDLGAESKYNPRMHPVLARYDPSRPYRWNYDHAPNDVPRVSVAQVSGEWSFCGRQVDSPLGIAAGPLLNGRWVLYYAALGFDVLTYKTTRSAARECYPLPNLVPVDVLALDQSGTQLFATTEMRGSWAVSFGMPSMSADEWRKDVEWTRKRLPPSKLLSVSVVASPQDGWSTEDLANDFAVCAKWAVESGADCVELNFSCPNVATSDGQLYQQPTSAVTVAERVRAAIHETPLIIKLGFLSDENRIEELVEALGQYASALSMSNCISAWVRNADNSPLFHGESRGIGGSAIKSASVEQVRRFSRAIRRSKWSVQLIGVGGIRCAADVREYLNAGAQTVQLATSVMLNPLVGCEIRSEL